MSCSHCAQAVITELNQLGGEVTIDLVPAAPPTSPSPSHRPLPGHAISRALRRADGYQLIP